MGEIVDRRVFLKGSLVLGGAAALGGASAARDALGGATSAPEAPTDLAAVKGTNAFAATRRALESLGGIGRFVRPAATAGLLINHPFRHPGTHVNPAGRRSISGTDSCGRSCRSTSDPTSNCFRSRSTRWAERRGQAGSSPGEEEVGALRSAWVRKGSAATTTWSSAREGSS